MAAHRKTTRSDNVTIIHVIQTYMLIYAVSQHLSLCKEDVLNEFLQTATEFLSETNKKKNNNNSVLKIKLPKSIKSKSQTLGKVLSF